MLSRDELLAAAPVEREQPIRGRNQQPRFQLVGGGEHQRQRRDRKRQLRHVEVREQLREEDFAMLRVRGVQAERQPRHLTVAGVPADDLDHRLGRPPILDPHQQGQHFGLGPPLPVRVAVHDRAEVLRIRHLQRGPNQVDRSIVRRITPRRIGQRGRLEDEQTLFGGKAVPAEAADAADRPLAHAQVRAVQLFEEVIQTDSRGHGASP